MLGTRTLWAIDTLDYSCGQAAAKDISFRRPPAVISGVCVAAFGVLAGTGLRNAWFYVGFFIGVSFWGDFEPGILIRFLHSV